MFQAREFNYVVGPITETVGLYLHVRGADDDVSGRHGADDEIRTRDPHLGKVPGSVRRFYMSDQGRYTTTSCKTPAK